MITLSTKTEEAFTKDDLELLLAKMVLMGLIEERPLYAEHRTEFGVLSIYPKGKLFTVENPDGLGRASFAQKSNMVGYVERHHNFFLSGVAA